MVDEDGMFDVDDGIVNDDGIVDDDGEGHLYEYICGDTWSTNSEIHPVSFIRGCVKFGLVMSLTPNFVNAAPYQNGLISLTLLTSEFLEQLQCHQYEDILCNLLQEIQ